MTTPPPIEFASLGMWDSLILMLMALVVFGPRRLPEIGRKIGKIMYEVRKASNDFKFQMEEELRKADDADRRKKEEERLSTLALASPNSQVLELGPGAPAGNGTPLPDGQFPAPSPYPDEVAYPAVSPGDFQREEPYPRIQPPSTGEPVPADRPGRMAERGEIPADEAVESTPEQAPHD
jgi:sec-independent protein translocase protein TatB